MSDPILPPPTEPVKALSNEQPSVQDAFDAWLTAQKVLKSAMEDLNQKRQALDWALDNAEAQ